MDTDYLGHFTHGRARRHFNIEEPFYGHRLPPSAGIGNARNIYR